MKTKLSLVFAVLLPLVLPAASNQILGWNNLGMHCMDSDYSVFSILPPYNTFDAQLIVGGRLVTNGSGYTVTYQAVADPSGSINKSSIGKGNWNQYVALIFGGVAPDQGLPFPGPDTFWMPGSNNVPQRMLFEQTNHPAATASTPVNWFYAYGVPITPYDDAGHKNPYPMMRLIAKNAANQTIATNDIVLPVSDEMDCRVCHASGSMAAAKPAAGWVWSGIQERDFRLNILRLHDEHQFAAHHDVYVAALASQPGNGKHFNPQGLYQSVIADNQPVLCAACHASEALGGGGVAGIPPLTESVHKLHAHVVDPLSNTTLDSAANRSACYRCHPGSATKCLRGAMGGAIAADGSMAMQCQSCHGSMSLVGTPFPQRIGWFMEPNCQSCHTGTATNNNGQIRYTTSFTNSTWGERIPVNRTFATQSNTPAAGISLFRFSRGHGGLQCSACHGSTHAEFPATHANDNVRNEKIQGHAGVMIECTACHTAMPNTITNGPHGLHPLGDNWAQNHGDLFEDTPPVPPLATRQQCQVCHGTTYKGTVLSRVHGSRIVTTKFGIRNFWSGQQISCFDCHDGASSSNPSANTPPTAGNVTAGTLNSAPVNLTLSASDPNGNSLTFRVVSQPAHGSVGVSNRLATYFPDAGYVGSDTFTFAANDTYSDSNLATGIVTVAQGPYSISLAAHVPTNSPVGWPVALAAVPAVTNYSGPVTFSWNFGDGSPANTNQFPTHTYVSSGAFNWSVSATASNATVNASGSIAISAPMTVSVAGNAGQITIGWPGGVAVVLEETSTLGTGALWTAVTNAPVLGGNVVYIPVPSGGAKFYRVRQAW